VKREILKALQKAMEDHERFGRIYPANDDFSESGDMRVIGISRSDVVMLTDSLQKTYGMGLATGWDCPTCGRLRDEDGDCPDGHEFDPQTPEGGKFATLLVVVEICLSVGVHLERSRWEPGPQQAA
jgi:hypothetical protein